MQILQILYHVRIIILYIHSYSVVILYSIKIKHTLTALTGLTLLGGPSGTVNYELTDMTTVKIIRILYVTKHHIVTHTILF